MEIIYFNIILILSGIILGGIVFLAILSPAIGRSRDTDVHYGNQRVSPGSLLLGIMFLVLLALFTFKDSSQLTSISSERKEAVSPKSPVLPPFEKAMAKLNTAPTTVEKEKPAPIKTEGLKGYYWQIAAFGTNTKAEQMYAQIQINNHLRPYVIKGENHFGTPVFKVIIGNFENRYTAEAFAVQNGIAGFVISLEGEDNERLR